MAQLTPQEIIEISEPIEEIYQRTVDELLINIAKHFKSGAERTAYWEIKKLSEVGALTKESAKIIAKNTQMLPKEVKSAFLQVAQKACLDIDPQLKDAALKGILQDPANTVVTSPEIQRLVQGYVDQAVDKMNMTNTTMLESTKAAYTKAVNAVASEVQLTEAQKILETQALSVTTQTQTRTQAIRKAMAQMSEAGLTGFYDSAGRKWSPEAYVSMVIRTTSHNAAVQSIKTRQMEFGGGDIFQVSAHAGARPLCYPYQGKFFSWSTSGVFTDGAGKEHEYDIITDSSYGEPAGLFGINCGHHPIPMIPGYSYPQDQDIQPPEENKQEYEESQKQRQYERNIREAKRDLEIAKATGDEEAVKLAEARVKQEQANMRGFIKETGRARRYDREQIAPPATIKPVKVEPQPPEGKTYKALNEKITYWEEKKANFVVGTPDWDNAQAQIEAAQAEIEKKAAAAEKSKITKQLNKVEKQIADYDTSKVYSNIWINDVTVKDYPSKSASIQAKLDYFENKIVHGADLAEMQKWQGMYDLTKEYQADGQAYQALIAKKNLLQKQKNASTLKLADNDAFTADRKNAALWAQSPKEFDDVMRASTGELWQQASTAERRAVYGYTSGSGGYNRPLSSYEGNWMHKRERGQVDLDYEGRGAEIKKMTELLDKTSSPVDVWLQRGCDDTAMESYLGLAEGTLGRMSEEELQQFVGQGFRVDAFFSCGSAKGRGFSGSEIINTYVPEGTKMIYAEPFSAYTGASYKGLNWDGIKTQRSFGYEDETIIQRGAYYRITKVEKTDYRRYWDFEVHPEAGYEMLEETEDYKKWHK